MYVPTVVAVYEVELVWIGERVIKSICPRCGEDMIGRWIPNRPLTAAHCYQCGTQYRCKGESTAVTLMTPTLPNRWEILRS